VTVRGDGELDNDDCIVTGTTYIGFGHGFDGNREPSALGKNLIFALKERDFVLFPEEGFAVPGLMEASGSLTFG